MLLRCERPGELSCVWIIATPFSESAELLERVEIRCPGASRLLGGSPVEAEARGCCGNGDCGGAASSPFADIEAALALWRETSEGCGAMRPLPTLESCDVAIEAFEFCGAFAGSVDEIETESPRVTSDGGGAHPDPISESDESQRKSRSRVRSPLPWTGTDDETESMREFSGARGRGHSDENEL
eukprot:Amastigsp_a515317_3.p2 type:complete len:184 gc:universal Amastigsp_a515317_3:852-301(-)